MERNFMCLAVKQEIPDEAIDAAPIRSAVMPWSFPNKTSGPRQLLSFQSAQEQNPKTGFDSLTSAGLVTITTSESFNSESKSYSGLMQKNVSPENQGGVRYTVTTYPTKQPVTTHTNMIGSLSPQPISGHPIADPVSTMPSTSPVVGTTNLRNASKNSAPAQLTIFYNGSVCVYDNISSEKAQAIMLLAGIGNPTTSSSTVPAAPVPASPVPASPVQASMHRSSSVFDGFVKSQYYATTQHLSSPTAVTSFGVSHSSDWSAAINEARASKQWTVLESSSRVDPMKVVNFPRSASATSVQPGSVPQFRRKSLARFLEKRKERVINASPYDTEQSPDCSTTKAGSTSLSMNSSGSCPLPVVN